MDIFANLANLYTYFPQMVNVTVSLYEIIKSGEKSSGSWVPGILTGV
jgi:hypothetical protein